MNFTSVKSQYHIISSLNFTRILAYKPTLLLVGMFLFSLMHFACYQYFTHFFLSSKTLGKKSNSYKDIVTSPLSSERKKHCTRKCFLLFTFFLQEALHTHLQKIKHNGSRFLDNLDQGTKVRIGGSRERESEPRNRLGGKLQKLESSKFSA